MTGQKELQDSKQEMVAWTRPQCRDKSLSISGLFRNDGNNSQYLVLTISEMLNFFNILTFNLPINPIRGE